jgi:hypothetical protein
MAGQAEDDAARAPDEPKPIAMAMVATIRAQFTWGT